MINRHLIFLLVMLFAMQSMAQKTTFNRGINLTNWFQANSAAQIQFTKYTKKDFEQIKSLGCDVIRLPINLHFMTKGAPDYTLDLLFLSMLDQAVNWAEELEIHLLLDNHTFDPATNTDPNVGIVLEKVWRQMAQHYKNRSGFIYYEILNEPHGISDAAWNAIQQKVIDVIRQVDTRHTIIVGGAGWNSYNNLAAIPVYNDNNLIYTFHFYDPFLFTHQGASWVEPSMVPCANVPFPFSAGKMPTMPSSVAGTWVGSAYSSYVNDGTVAKVKQLIDIAVKFRDERKVPIFCGEFGVFMNNSPEQDRVYWYDVVRKYLEEKNISWTMWDYHGGFGLFNKGSNGLFNHDLNVPLLQSLNFNVPPQTPFKSKPDTTGFKIYSDFIESLVYESSYGSGDINYYTKDQPNNGSYCLRWSNPKQYDIIGLDLTPDRDLTYLVNNNFALDFIFRTDAPAVSFGVRFLDTDTSDPNDRPWRRNYIIKESMTNGDRKWYHFHIPLKSFTEQGAWENGTWYNPVGAFDWKAVDRFEIVAEVKALPNNRLWFDNIQITNLDTAKIYDNTVFTTSVNSTLSDLEWKIFPNPAAEYLKVSTPTDRLYELVIFDKLGREIKNEFLSGEKRIQLPDISPGLYFIQLNDGKMRTTPRKLLIF
jgi:endoglucanase